MYAFSFRSAFKSVFKSIVFYENAQRISVDGRPKRMEMCAFSNENAIVWTIEKEKTMSLPSSLRAGSSALAGFDSG